MARTASHPALPLVAEEFLTWLRVEQGRSTNTLVAYRGDLRSYVNWLADRGRDLAGVTEADVTDYVGFLRAEGRAPSSAKRALVAVRALHRFSALEGMATLDPSADVALPKVPRGVPKALSEDEIGALIDAVQGNDPLGRRDRAAHLRAGRALAGRCRPGRRPDPGVRQGLEGAAGPAGALRRDRARGVAGAGRPSRGGAGALGPPG